ncbi:hypothetical protein D8674_024915 [Pyrus ussuriensis x Pyrus communis]|uniref:Sphingomyelin phosphodiesterase 4 n=1 Tax=Pyrus ussuriensis x Pyrus communis TaxID=2448454 RepID=A0A5N5H878_9ROSA|nr:hypothetical protein D8674_024915 [Pyrus ussuriensis x Pyrus communis]
MLPHSYALNSHSKSQDLACTILASSAPHQISSTCASIESFLHSLSPDQSRHFFSLTFPTLICKLFGFDDAASSPLPPPQPASQQQPSPSAPSASPNGWIDTVLASNDIDLANRLFALLAPNSLLFNAISAVDRLSLVKYVFPIERLPEWVRFMLTSENDIRVLSDLSPILKNRVKEDSIKPNFYQVQLNVFEYYTFWFAYYPVCRGNSEHCDVVSIKRNRRFKFENWVSSISGFSSTRREAEVKIECNLYIRLLYAYLRAFVGATDLNQHLPYRSSLLHYSSGYDTSVIAQAEFFVNALVNFWLVDNDFSPLPVNLCKSFGVSFPFRSVLGETPPTPGLGEVVKLFVKYLNVGLVVHRDGNESVDHCGSPRQRGSFDALKLRDVMSVSPCTGSWNLLIQRPLYRFLLRTFLFCPGGVLIKNISEVFSVWITYIEPWDIILDFSELDAVVDGSTKNGRNDNLQPQNHGYTPSWQGYVLASYLYYSSLVMHFIGFAHKFLHTDPEIIVQMVLKILTILTSSKELMDLLKMVDTAFHSKQAGSGKSMLNSLYRFVTPIREQLQDWEDGLSESDADGSFLHENWNKDLRLFSDGEDGGQQLLQLFILRAEAELLAVSGDNGAHNLQCIDSLKAQVSCLFGGHTVKVLSFSPEPKQPLQPRDEIFKPRRVSNRTLDGVKYRGDWMKRPISDNEVAWLARLLVEFSSWINERLGLNQSESSQADPTYVEVSRDVLGNVFGPMDTMQAVLGAVGSWLVMLGVAMVKLMRKHGLRVNLRMLASKKFVMVLLLSAVYSILKKAFGMYLWG